MIPKQPTLQGVGAGLKVPSKTVFYGNIEEKDRNKIAVAILLMMQAFAQTADAVAATTKKLEKVRLVAEYFRSRPVDEAAQAAVFFSGRAFPPGRSEHCRWAARCCGGLWEKYRAREKLR